MATTGVKPQSPPFRIIPDRAQVSLRAPKQHRHQSHRKRYRKTRV